MQMGNICLLTLSRRKQCRSPEILTIFYLLLEFEVVLYQLYILNAKFSSTLNFLKEIYPNSYFFFFGGTGSLLQKDMSIFSIKTASLLVSPPPNRPQRDHTKGEHILSQ